MDPQEGPRKGTGPAALSPLPRKLSHSNAKQDKRTGPAPRGAGRSIPKGGMQAGVEGTPGPPTT